MGTPATIDAASSVLRPGPAALFPLPLKVFISYKQKDVAAAEHIRQQLEKIGGSNGIEVFVSGDDHVIKAAQDWRRIILQNLREAHVLIFLYTDPSLHWDWCLYETGYFDGRQDPQQLDRRLYLLHRGDVNPVGPFLGLKTVPVFSKDDPDDKQLKSFLQILFTESTEPPVNRNWDKPDCAELLAAFKEPFGGTTVKPITFIRRLTYRVAKGKATEEALLAGRIPLDARVSGTKESFALFNLSTDTERSWEELESQWRQKMPPPADATEADLVILWVGNLAGKMLAAMRGEQFDDGLPLFYCPFMRKSERALFRPSLAQMTEHTSAFEFDVVFVDMTEEVSARSTGPLTTVGILLRLSHMFRFGWIEPMDRALVDATPSEVPGLKAEILRRLNSITAESFNQGLRTEAAVLQAFTEGSMREQAQTAMTGWKEKITPMFDQAMKETAPEPAAKALRDVLKQASAVNWQFHRACAQRYAQLIEEYATANRNPDERV
jgi:TIR domain